MTSATSLVSEGRSLSVFNDVESQPKSRSDSLQQSLLSWKPPKTDLGPPPDRGVLAWLQVFAGFCLCAMTWGLITSFGVFQTYYQRHITPTPSASDVSWIGTLQIFFLFFCGAFVGRASDAGYARVTVAAGSFLLVFGLMMASIARQYYHLVLSRGVCVGLGMGLAYLPGLSVSSAYFNKRRSLAVGLLSSGAGVGGIIYPAIAQQLLPRAGHAWTLRAIAFVTLIFALAFNLLLRPRVPPRKAGPIIEWRAFSEVPYVSFGLGFFFIYWSGYFVFYYVDDYGFEFTGFTESDSANLLLISNALGIPGRVLPGAIASLWLGPLNTAIPTATLVSIIIFCWIAVGHSNAGLWIFAAMYGLFASAVQGLFAVCLASLTDDMSKVGTRMGTCIRLLRLRL